MSRFIGIDFSGGARPWRRSVSRPSVWIAIVEADFEKPRLVDLIPVQALAGTGAPFERLARFLSAGDFTAAGIDAPFSLPLDHMPPGGHDELLRKALALPNGPGRPFPLGKSIVELGEAVAPKSQAKPLRATEAIWAARKVNVRSTMWVKPRGGAPFAAACLRLIGLSGRPCWPWNQFEPGILCEAFPAAQLQHWGLPYMGYSGSVGATVRAGILAGLDRRVRMSSAHAQIAAENPDALDAIIAVFAAIAVASGTVVAFNAPYADGFIAVAE